MKIYKHLFFDLDRTLWDFDVNSKDTLKQLLEDYHLTERFKSFSRFHNIYKSYNEILWRHYRNKEIGKLELSWQRFHLTFKEVGIDDETLAKEFGKSYLKISPTKTKLFDGTHQVLTKLQKQYNLHIITNGFSEVQFSKIKRCDLEKYFKNIITSEEAGFQKPSPEIFLFALKKCNASTEESIMIGDDFEVDIKGAKALGIDQVWFNNSGKKRGEATFHINKLNKLLDIF